MSIHANSKGYTLIELMIVIAIIAIVTAIAVPAYNGYIREGHFATMRADMSGLRTPIEDYRLENGSYVGATGIAQIADLLTDINAGSYTFTVSLSSNSYDVLGVFSPGVWVRCENRMNRCCDADKNDATQSDCNF